MTSPTEDESAEVREFTPAEEAAYQRVTRRAIAAAIVVLIVVFTTAGIVGTRAISRRFAGADNLDQARRLLNAADPFVLDVDEVVRAETNEDVAKRARTLLGKVAAAEKDLTEAIRLVDASMNAITDDEREIADLLKAAASARLEMLKPAKVILDATAKAGEALGPAEAGWTIVVAAEKLADDSVKQYNLLTKAGVTQSSKLAEQASAELERARPYFSQAATAFPEAGLDRYTAFIDAKVALLALSRQSNSLWLAGKVAEANKVIVKYNAQDKAAVALADALPDSTGTAIAEAYEAVAGSSTEDYFSARKKAAAADTRLKTY